MIGEQKAAYRALALKPDSNVAATQIALSGVALGDLDRWEPHAPCGLQPLSILLPSGKDPKPFCPLTFTQIRVNLRVDIRDALGKFTSRCQKTAQIVVTPTGIVNWPYLIEL